MRWSRQGIINQSHFDKKLQEIESLKNVVARQQKLILDEQYRELFATKSVYPKNWQAVGVGDTIEDVNKAYGHFSIDRSSKSFWSIEPNGDFFDYITFYFEKTENQSFVTHIMFRLAPYRFWEGRFNGDKPSLDNDFLKRQIEKVLGTPTITKSIYHHRWKLKSGENVFMTSNKGFIIMRAGYYPRTWPK